MSEKEAIQFAEKVIFSKKHEVMGRLMKEVVNSDSKEDFMNRLKILAKFELGMISRVEPLDYYYNVRHMKEIQEQGWDISELSVNASIWKNEIIAKIVAPNGNRAEFYIYMKEDRYLAKEEWQKLQERVKQLEEELLPEFEKKKREVELKKLQERVKRLEEELNETRKENTELHEKLGRLKKYLRILIDKYGIGEVASAIVDAEKEEDYAKIRDQILEELDMEEDYDP